jgi:hypothetical protein
MGSGGRTTTWPAPGGRVGAGRPCGAFGALLLLAMVSTIDAIDENDDLGMLGDAYDAIVVFFDGDGDGEERMQGRVWKTVALLK